MASVAPTEAGPEFAEVRCPRCGRRQMSMALVPGSSVRALRCKSCPTFIFAIVEPDGALKVTYARTGPPLTSG